MKFLSLAASLLLAAVIQKPAAPQSTESMGTPDAKVFFDQGQAAMKGTADYGKAADLFRKAIDADPRYVEAHSRFMFATRQAAQAEARKAGVPSKDASDKT